MYSHFGGAEVIALRYPEIEAAVRESVDGVLRAPANGASEGDFANAAIAISAELYQRDFLPREVNVEASLRGSSLSLAGLMSIPHWKRGVAVLVSTDASALDDIAQLARLYQLDAIDAGIQIVCSSRSVTDTQQGAGGMPPSYRSAFPVVPAEIWFLHGK